MTNADDFMEQGPDSYHQGHLTHEIATGDPRRSLVALRDQLAAKIDAGPCTHCGGPRGEMAGMASTIKELRAIIEAIQLIPDANAEVTPIDRIRAAHNSRMPDAPDTPTSRKSQTRQSGSRRPGAGGGSRPGPMAGNAG